MIRGIILFLASASLCFSRPNDLEDMLGLFPAEENLDLALRAESKSVTANQMLDSIVQRAVEKIKEAGWGSSKRVQNGHSTIPFQVNSGDNSNEQFFIRDGWITGLNSLRRSKTASFSNKNSELRGTLVLEKACAMADYTVKFSGVGAAPAQTTNGKVTECDDKLFADITIGLEDFVPQNIKSYNVRSGHDSVNVSNMVGNSMAKVHEAGIRKALRQHLEKTMATNVKVKVNQSIQDMKTEDTPEEPLEKCAALACNHKGKGFCGHTKCRTHAHSCIVSGVLKYWDPKCCPTCLTLLANGFGEAPSVNIETRDTASETLRKWVSRFQKNFQGPYLSNDSLRCLLFPKVLPNTMVPQEQVQSSLIQLKIDADIDKALEGMDIHQERTSEVSTDTGKALPQGSPEEDVEHSQAEQEGSVSMATEDPQFARTSYQPMPSTSLIPTPQPVTHAVKNEEILISTAVEDGPPRTYQELY
ncbi:uncharacterized protein [Palaemon carinicauda]|uniref:uncharacterized protein n=1 Tax=Palaemon carinicauda TaxID=392227 RepID=UPI0035B667D2